MLVVDALDECQDATEIDVLLRLLCNLALSPVACPHVEGSRMRSLDFSI